MYLTEYTLGDIDLVNPETEQYLITAYESDPDIAVRTFRNEEGTPIAIGMCAKSGEIGLIVKHELITNAMEFYTLVVVFCVEGFVHSGADSLFTGFNPDSRRDRQWCRFLRMQVSDTQIDEHTERGLVTYEFPLTNWAR